MDTFDYRGFLEKNKLGPYRKTGKLNENYVDLRPVNSMNEDLEELSNPQEDEDNDEVTNAPTEPQPIEVVSMGSHGAVIKVEKPNGDIEDVEFELDGDIEEVDPPYGYEGTIYGEIDGVEYGIAVSLVDMGGGGYDMDLSYDGLMFVEGRVQESNDNVDAGKIGFTTGKAPKAKQNSTGNHNMMDKQSDTREPAAGSVMDQIRKSKGLSEEEGMEATKEDPNYIQQIVKSYSLIKDLERAGVISKQELERFLDGLQPIYTRLK